jgi:hypothetical protein
MLFILYIFCLMIVVVVSLQRSRGNATANVMRAALVWFEPEAALAATWVLLNDLDLTLRASDGKVYSPNGAAAADLLNTVE